MYLVLVVFVVLLFAARRDEETMVLDCFRCSARYQGAGREGAAKVLPLAMRCTARPELICRLSTLSVATEKRADLV